jgi:hypothetical protein
MSFISQNLLDVMTRLPLVLTLTPRPARATAAVNS